MWLSEAEIRGMTVAQLKEACRQRVLIVQGNKAHLVHRLLRLCGHVPWNAQPPPGGSAAERAASQFHAPGHMSYPVNPFIITTGVRGGHIVMRHFQKMLVWVGTYAEQGITCMEYGPKDHLKHAHSVVRVRWPSARIGSPENIALRFHIRTFLRYTERSQYVHVKPVEPSNLTAN